MRLTKNKILHPIRNRKPDPKMGIEATLKWYDKEIKKNPKDTGLYYAKAAILAKEGRYEKSINTLDKIIELTPENLKVHYIKANTLYKIKRYEEAVECFDVILVLSDDDERVWYHKGEALCKLERYRESIDCFDKAIEIDRDYTEAWLGRGFALRMLRLDDLEDDPEDIDEERIEDLEDSLKSYSFVADLDPNSEQAWHGKGNALYDLGRYNEALPCYDRCIKINPVYVRGWFGKGRALKKLGRLNEAEISFQNITEVLPDDSFREDPETWVTKANSYYELGQYEKALECFDKILEKYPGNNFALDGKASMLEKLGRKEEALRCYRESIDNNSIKASTWYRIGNLQDEVGDFDTALESYNEAVQISPDFEKAWLRIGDLLRRKNKYDEARKCFEWILKINSNNRRAKRILTDMADGSRKLIAESKQNIDIHGDPEPESKDQIFNEEGSKRINTMDDKKFLESLIKRLEAEEENDDILVISPNEAFNTDITYQEEEDHLNNHENLTILLIEGKKHLDGGENQKALTCFNKAIKLDPQCNDAWNQKGDALLKMGKIEDACICYKRVISTMLQSKDPMEWEGKLTQHGEREKWRDTIAAFLEDVEAHSDAVSRPTFSCPRCGYKVGFEEKYCSGCDTIFFEEIYMNKCPEIDDDLMFFDELREILFSKKTFFIHFDGENGIIRYLEERRNRNTGRFEYFIVRGKIEKMGWDYSFEKRLASRMKEIDGKSQVQKKVIRTMN